PACKHPRESPPRAAPSPPPPPPHPPLHPRCCCTSAQRRIPPAQAFLQSPARPAWPRPSPAQFSRLIVPLTHTLRVLTLLVNGKHAPALSDLRRVSRLLFHGRVHFGVDISPPSRHPPFSK